MSIWQSMRRFMGGRSSVALDRDPGYGENRVEWTGPQAGDMVGMQGELSKPLGIDNAFYRKVRRIRRDPTVKMAREFTVAPFLASKWSYDCDDDCPDGAKESVEQEMEKHRLLLVRSSVLGCIDFGHQTYEKIWVDRPDGSWGFELKPLLPDITDVIVDAKTGRYIGIQQNPLTIGGIRFGFEQKVFLTRQCAAIINIDVEGTGWYGEPVMKALEVLYDEQAGIQKSARKYDAKVAGSHWVVYYPLGTGKLNGVVTDNALIAKQLIENIEAVGGIAIPRSVVQAIDTMNENLASNESLMWKVELLSDKGSGQAPFLERFKYIDVLKVRAFGWPERAMLEGQFGTKAEADAHMDLGLLNMEAKNDLYCGQYNEQIVADYLEYNYGCEFRDCVKIKPAPLADRDKAALQKLYEIVFQNPQGFMQESPSVDWKALRDKLGIPELPLVDPYDELGEYMDADPMAEPYWDPTVNPETDPYMEPAYDVV